MRTQMATPKATIATIDFGPFQIQGLMLVDGTFAVAVSQVSELFQLVKWNATRDLKAILGAGFQFAKAASELNPKAVNILTLSQFETVVLRLAVKGNPTALELAELSIGLALTQRFSDAFGVQFEKSERDKWIKSRSEGILARRTFTDGIKDYIDRSPSLSVNARKFLYPNASDKLNILLTGHTAAHWVKARSIDKDSLRNQWSSPQLDRIKSLEDLALRKIDRGMDPVEAVESAFEALLFEEWPEERLFGMNDQRTANRDYQRASRARKKAAA